ncbi:MAG: nicotinate-nucleotide--dimethylbenzimidazole phosphoribosyltransferase [Gluconacetobacter diazotrophicus]|nr:nicotinate-nucleotide--dimethylbenzimidazole phosphoribosyltransferase [Gluconacetobacter diazotrophicus]
MSEPLAVLRRDCAALPAGDAGSERRAASRQDRLTKPPGSLGRLEILAGWLARWQGTDRPKLDRVSVVVFAGNHGVTARGVSPYPAAVTAQMVANFAAGGAAINQLAALGRADLSVIPLAGLAPTRDISEQPALSAAEFAAAIQAGRDAVAEPIDLLCLGEMGIGNTTAAAALSAGLFGGEGADWAGRGTGIDDAGLQRKIAAVDAALRLHRPHCRDPLEAARRLGGHEFAAILGAVVQARVAGIPVLLDGFACTAAAAVLHALVRGGLDHAVVAHVSAEAGHRRLLTTLDTSPLLDLGLRLGEASGAALALPILRAAVACLDGMATFAEAGVSEAN